MIRRDRIVRAVVALFAALLLATAAHFGVHRAIAEAVRAGIRAATGELPDVPVIETHREAEVQRLFREHPLGSAARPGWRLMELAIQPRSIDVRVDGPEHRTAQMVLRHVDDVDAPWRHSASFAMVLAAHADPDGVRALEVLADDVARADDGHFWRTRSVVLLEGTESGRVAARTLRALQDGVALAALLLAVLAMVLWRALRDEPRWVRWTLVALTALGAALRLALAVRTTLDVWPYSRLLALPRMLFTSPTLAAITAHLGLRVHLNELVLTYTAAASVLAPAALFAHGKALLRDSRAALWAAAAITVLPAHIHFSRSDTGFIPSAVFASMAFALISQALRDPGTRWRRAALLAAPVLVLVTLEQRALNTMFPALYLAQIWLLQPADVPFRRRAVVTAVVLAAAALFLFGGFVEKNHGLIAEALGPRTLANAWHGLRDPRFDTLINRDITPPALLALAVAGLGALALGPSRRLVPFLVAWVAIFYTANSVVVPATAEMQSRYHLHLAAPFVLSAGVGIRALLDAAARRAPKLAPALAVAAAALLAAIPWMHRGYERRADFNDQREYAFVREVRARVPRGCMVLEHDHPGGGHDLRFGRMTRVLDRGVLRGEARPVLATGPSSPQGDPLTPAARTALQDPPDCLMVYLGLPCLGVKEPGEPVAPACAALRAAAPMDLVAHTRFASRPYDENASQGIMHQAVDVDLALYRVRVDEVRARRR